MNHYFYPGMPSRFKKNNSLSNAGMLKLKEANTIIEMVSNHFNLTDAVLKSKSRKRDISFPRQICMWLLATKTHMTLKDIGIMFGGRDHTCAIHARNTIYDLMEAHQDIRENIESVIHKYNNINVA
jgi:chromosomal replication initiator protein